MLHYLLGMHILFIDSCIDEQCKHNLQQQTKYKQTITGFTNLFKHRLHSAMKIKILYAQHTNYV